VFFHFYYQYIKKFCSLTNSRDNISKLSASRILLNFTHFSAAFSDINYSSGKCILELPLSCKIPKKPDGDILLSTAQNKSDIFFSNIISLL